MLNARAQPLTVDPESIFLLPDKFEIEMRAPDVPPEIARFHGARIRTWHATGISWRSSASDPVGHANVVFAIADSAFYDMNRESRQDEAAIADGVLAMTGFSHLPMRPMVRTGCG
jgi:hypothetical protein